MRRKALYTALTLNVFLFGCAPKIASLTGTYKGIDVQLTSTTSKQYHLLSGSQGHVGTAIPSKEGVMSFSLPMDRDTANSCFIIVEGSNNKPLSAETQKDKSIPFKFYNPIYKNYTDSSEKLENYSSHLTSTVSEIKNNPAFRNKACEKPKMGVIPPQPCDPKTQKQLSTAHCAVSSTQKQDACTVIANDFGRNLDTELFSILSNPQCDALSSDFLQYGLDATPGENVYSSADTAELVNKAGSFALGQSVKAWKINPLLGIGVAAAGGLTLLLNNMYTTKQKVVKFTQCVDTLQKECTEKYNTWVEEANDIESAPDRLLQACNTSKEKYYRLRSAIVETEKELAILKKQSVPLLARQCN